MKQQSVPQQETLNFLRRFSAWLKSAEGRQLTKNKSKAGLSDVQLGKALMRAFSARH